MAAEMNIKARVYNLGKTMKELVSEINKRGTPCTTTQMSDAITGRLTAPKTAAIIQAAMTILGEWENAGE